jgi:hypothetical protein
MHARPRRTVTAVVLGVLAPIMVAAAVFGMGERAETAGLGSKPALVAINPQQCVRDFESCMAAEAQGNPCDLLLC